jgi:hypothetical protein
MNIHDPVVEAFDECLRQYSHESGQHYQVRLVRPNLLAKRFVETGAVGKPDDSRRRFPRRGCAQAQAHGRGIVADDRHHPGVQFRTSTACMLLPRLRSDDNALHRRALCHDD